MDSINLLLSAETMLAQQKYTRIKFIKVMLGLFVIIWGLIGFALLVMFELQDMHFKDTHDELAQIDGRYQHYLLEKKSAQAVEDNLCNVRALQRVFDTPARGIGLYQLSLTENISIEGYAANETSLQNFRSLLSEWINIISWEKNTQPEQFSFLIEGEATCKNGY